MRVLVATGCTSGLGSLALSQFLSRLISTSPCLDSHKYLILAGHRSIPPRALSDQAERLNDKVELKWLELDLANLNSVRSFAQNVKRELNERGVGKVDTLLLNAAVWKAEYQSVGLRDKEYSKEAIVNHFAQYYLTQELLPLLSAPSEERSRIIFTTSSLQNGVKSLDDLLPLLTSPSTENSTSRSRYAASKLIQTISFHDLHRSLSSPGLSSPSSTAPTSKVEGNQGQVKVDIISVSPGFVPTTGLARETTWWQRILMRYVISWAPFCTTEEEGAKRIVDCMTLPSSELDSTPSTDSPDSIYSRFIFRPLKDSSNNVSLNALLAQVKEEEEGSGNEGQGVEKWEELRKVWMPSLGEMQGWIEGRGIE